MERDPGTRRGLIVVRGAGDLATGIMLRLFRSGFAVVALETDAPLSIRRSVSFAEAVYDGKVQVEGVEAVLAADEDEALALAERGKVPVLVDPRAESLAGLRPEGLVDAIMAKRNLGTAPDMASAVVALGPGFSAPEDAHAVIETNRGHYLGRVIRRGAAEKDTGTPGLIAGYGAERVVHAPDSGIAEAVGRIGDSVSAGQPILVLRRPDGSGATVEAPLAGVLRGIIRPGIFVPRGLKIADVDPRCVPDHCRTASDKALAVGGGALEALLSLGCRPS